MEVHASSYSAGEAEVDAAEWRVVKLPNCSSVVAAEVALESMLTPLLLLLSAV